MRTGAYRWWALSTTSLGAVLAGALVKGVTGIGLPMVAVPLMVQVMPVPTAISLLAVLAAGGLIIAIKAIWRVSSSRFHVRVAPRLDL